MKTVWPYRINGLNKMIANAELITGWMSREELEFLAEAARNANFILEFGCYQGRSTRALADNTNGIVYAVDPWGMPYYNDDGSQAGFIDTKNALKSFIENLKDHIDVGRVVPIHDYSWNFVSPIKFDFIFIDGDHRYEKVKDDIHLALRLIRAGGIIAGHDYTHPDWPGVKKAVDETFQGQDLQYNGSIWSIEVQR